MNISVFGALAETNRLDMVELLLKGPMSVNEIADRLHLNQPQTSKHLKVLSDAGLVEVHKVANRRIYKLRPRPLAEMDEWLGAFRRLWEERFDRLDDYLSELQGLSAQEPPKGDADRTP
ncbi:ArsR/SmtB family transcription factor [Cohnella thailandensis]|jgi:Predicted transcriptional regulator|uniref:Winged helix-turn-helix transcriptional regulator n=1 Tax=Cohnella thailandensis TaxID=557557 RepID=A0A841SXM2_9BACL|nr:metalloregulator ArsR/SmtB family transcription factor [Cohnella thailandensis]MBB6634928.1 winged helix-turn-helix transcriptional regulator [Cohnella thailandensis]MBP1975850.1 DNA-binding transcriptional ArsR family regulator [Cohnella thailandensis]